MTCIPKQISEKNQEKKSVNWFGWGVWFKLKYMYFNLVPALSWYRQGAGIYRSYIDSLLFPSSR